jgi:hypothetical protein
MSCLEDGDEDSSIRGCYVESPAIITKVMRKGTAFIVMVKQFTSATSNDLLWFATSVTIYLQVNIYPSVTIHQPTRRNISE